MYLADGHQGYHGACVSCLWVASQFCDLCNSCLQTFGKLQSKLFPKYFALLSSAMAVCLGTITFAPGAVLPRGQLVSLGEEAHHMLHGQKKLCSNFVLA